MAVNNKNGSAEIYAFDTGVSIHLPPFETINEKLGDQKILDSRYLDSAKMELAMFLDSQNVLVNFSCFSDGVGQQLKGWFVFDCAAYTVKDLAVQKA